MLERSLDLIALGWLFCKQTRKLLDVGLYRRL